MAKETGRAGSELERELVASVRDLLDVAAGVVKGIPARHIRNTARELLARIDDDGAVGWSADMLIPNT